MLDVIVLLGAEIEFQSAYGRLCGSGREDLLEAEFAEALANLSRFPNLGPVFRSPYHRLLLSDFPHALYYSVQGSRVFIHAFADTRQDLAAILRRLGLEP